MAVGISGQAMEKLTEEKGVTEVNLVEVIGDLISAEMNSVLGESFKNLPMIKDVYDKNNAVQIVIINRYFVNLLLRFRAKNDVPVNDVLMMITHDGEVSDWVKLYRTYVLPFINKKNVFANV